MNIETFEEAELAYETARTEYQKVKRAAGTEGENNSTPLMTEAFLAVIESGCLLQSFRLKRKPGADHLVRRFIAVQHVVIAAAVKRRVEIDQIDGLVLDVVAKYLKIVAVVESVHGLKHYCGVGCRNMSGSPFSFGR